LIDSSKLSNSAAFCTGALEDYELIITNAESEPIRPLLKAGARVINK
jgi:hypothetical protein